MKRFPSILIRSGIAVAILALLWFAFFPREESRDMSIRSACLSNLKRIAMAGLLYAEDSQRFPPASCWTEAMSAYGEAHRDEALHFSCPEVLVNHGTYGYAYNSLLALSPVSKSNLPDEKTPMFFDSTSLIRDTADPVTSLPPNGRHVGRNNIAYVDGHVKSVAPVMGVQRLVAALDQRACERLSLNLFRSAGRRSQACWIKAARARRN